MAKIELRIGVINYLIMISFMIIGLGYIISESEQFKVKILKDVYLDNPINHTTMNKASLSLFDKPYSNLEPEEFHILLQAEYKYTNYTDCKYWSYVWYAYFKSNKNIDSVSIVETENHVFIVAGDETGYYIADLNNLSRIGQIN